MTDVTYVPTKTTRVSADGFTFELLEVDHIYHASLVTAVQVDTSAAAAVHLPTAGQTFVTVTLAATGASPTNPAQKSFGKKATIPATSATGTYTFVIRHAGEAGGFKNDL
jgi:hypothetical protein